MIINKGSSSGLEVMTSKFMSKMTKSTGFCPTSKKLDYVLPLFVWFQKFALKMMMIIYYYYIVIISSSYILHHICKSVYTWKDEVQQDGASSVFDIADGGKVNVQDQEKDAAKETGHTHSDTIVTGISVVVEDAEQTLTADVDVALIHDAAEYHHGENLQRECVRRQRHKGCWFII